MLLPPQLPVPALVQQCAPFVAPATMTAIVKVESGGDPLAMWNNTTGQRVVPATRKQAEAYLHSAIAAGDKVDVGIAQVDTENFAQYGLTVRSAFNPCTNVRVGAKILLAAYRAAHQQYPGNEQVALFHAFEAYNSGRLVGDSSYANQILAAAGIPVYVSSGGGLQYAYRAHPAGLQQTVYWGKPTTTGWGTAKSW